MTSGGLAKLVIAGWVLVALVLVAGAIQAAILVTNWNNPHDYEIGQLCARAILGCSMRMPRRGGPIPRHRCVGRGDTNA
ncbi:MAG: hypothetical protein ABR529_04655 [Actinomycetota bacterium]